MRYVIGCTEDQRGIEAIALGLAVGRALAAPTSIELELVHIVPGADPEEAGTLSERAYQNYLKRNAEEWLEKSAAFVPEGVAVRRHVKFADSMVEGLLSAVEEFEAELVVVGAASKGPFKRFTVGSVANGLLHSSPVPVALAPSGYRSPREISRISCALGTRPGAEAVLDVAVDAASTRHVPLRLISLVTLDPEASSSEGGATDHAERTLATAKDGVAGRTLVTVDVAQGRSIEEAIEALEWDDSEIVMIGSSRLAARTRIFLGATANKMLRALPVPMIVVPRDYVAPHATGDRTATGG